MSVAVDYLSQVKPLEDAGQTDEEIVAAILQDTRHHRDVMAVEASDSASDSVDLHHILIAKFGVLRQGSGGAWKGPLVDYMDDLDESNALRIGFENLLSQFTSSGRAVYCSSHAPTGYLVTAIAAIVDSMTQSAGHSAGDVIAAVHAVTGGPRWDGLTTDDIAAARLAYQKSTLIADAVITENAQQQIFSKRRTRIASLEDVADSLTTSEIQTQIDLIRTDPTEYTLPGGE